MTLDERIDLLDALGIRLDSIDDREDWQDAILSATHHNAWFTIENVKFALRSLRMSFFSRAKIKEWLESYDLSKIQGSKRVGIICAGNIPLVGLHDVLCTFICGHVCLIKYSDKDTILMKKLIQELEDLNPESKSYFEEVGKVENPDAIIATGSNNTGRYFEAYFSKYANIIRKNRNAVGVLYSESSIEDIIAFGNDIFMHYGLGCRNISKLLIPIGFRLDLILEGLHDFNTVMHHNKYKNNFDYNVALYMLNKTQYLNNGSLALTENPSLSSRISTIHYEYYLNEEDLQSKLLRDQEGLQCIVSGKSIKGFNTILPGLAQSPGLSDYADNVDTIEFLSNI
jgi:hypothetical protein